MKTDRPIKKHTFDKLEYVRKYVHAYAKVTKKARKRCYVEGFAGPGLNAYNLPNGQKRVVPGSPLIALSATPPFDEYHFVELNKAYCDGLRFNVTDKFNALQDRVKIHQGDCNVEVPRILNGFNARTPIFLFLDPEGTELKWNTLHATSRHPKVELFLLFYYSGIARNMRLPQASNNLDEFFGTREWREIQRIKPNLTRKAFLTFYQKRLRSLGYTYEAPAVPIKSGGRHLYFLLWRAHKDNPQGPLGQKIMTDVLTKSLDSQVTLDL